MANARRLLANNLRSDVLDRVEIAAQLNAAHALTACVKRNAEYATICLTRRGAIAAQVELLILWSGGLFLQLRKQKIVRGFLARYAHRTAKALSDGLSSAGMCAFWIHWQSLVLSLSLGKGVVVGIVAEGVAAMTPQVFLIHDLACLCR